MKKKAQKIREYIRVGRSGQEDAGSGDKRSNEYRKFDRIFMKENMEEKNRGESERGTQHTTQHGSKTQHGIGPPQSYRP